MITGEGGADAAAPIHDIRYRKGTAQVADSGNPIDFN